MKKDTENIKKDLSEIKNVISEINNTLEGINNGLIIDFENKVEKNKQQQKKTILKNEESLRNI